MAQDKKSFVLYADLIKSIEHLTNEEKGILFNHLLEYVNDMNPILEDRLVLTAWKPIELQLKRDLIKFEVVKAKRSDAGKRSAELRALKNDEQNSTNSTSVDFVQQTSTNSTVNDNVNVNDICNTNITSNDVSQSINWQKLIIQFNELYNKKTLSISEKVKSSFKARIKEGYTKENIVEVMDNIKKDTFHIENAFNYVTLEYISRPNTMDKYINFTKPKNLTKKIDKL
jgi:dihydroneopterin aldolase